MKMDIIRSEKIGTRYLTLLQWEDTKTYAIQYSNNDDIIENLDGYCRKKDAEKEFNVLLKRAKILLKIIKPQYFDFTIRDFIRKWR